MHVRLKNLKKVKSEIKEEFEQEYQKKEEKWIKKIEGVKKTTEELDSLKIDN
jgi:hypothetical protein